VKFPLYLRIPGWADTVSINFKNKSIKGKAGSTVKILEKWFDGDQVTMEIPMNIRTERRYNNSLAILRGPLFFSLRIAKEYKSVKINYDNFGYKGSVDWEINPKSDWNYGLMIDPGNVTRGINVTENNIGKYPFADKGDMIWSNDSSKYILWEKDAPVIIKTRGVKIPGWIMKNNSAEIPPLSPVTPEGDPQIIELVPYGSAKLRITEFPVMDIILMETIMK